MLQRMNSEQMAFRKLGLVFEQSENVRIDVFTSEYCSFCEDALEVARTAAGNLACLGSHVEVVETSVDAKPELIEALNLVALPLIQVGRSQIIGLPLQEDIERLIHEKLLMGQ
ncbi:hypothetical protein EU528_08235 [Candidatus Thorarchaeota archaeon]|nr:MAG: hypothetical protein EU528_08235 [Candidatus Thorarchaeota archaeon]